MTVQTLSRADYDRFDRTRFTGLDRPPPPTLVSVERSIYRSRGVDPVSAVAAVLVAAAAFASFQYLGIRAQRKPEQRLTMIKLMELPKPPPPAAPPVPKSKAAPHVQPEIVVPPAVVASPAPPATLAIAAAPAPPQPAPAVAAADSPVGDRPAAAPSAAPASVDLSSKMIVATPPTYPNESRRLREQGTVILSVLLSIDGRVDRISIAQSSGFYRLDRAATGAVRHWRWSPTLRDGQPVLVEGNVVIPFVLRS
jgi:protein TonB